MLITKLAYGSKVFLAIIKVNTYHKKHIRNITLSCIVYIYMHLHKADSDKSFYDIQVFIFIFGLHFMQ